MQKLRATLSKKKIQNSNHSAQLSLSRLTAAYPWAVTHALGGSDWLAWSVFWFYYILNRWVLSLRIRDAFCFIYERLTERKNWSPCAHGSDFASEDRWAVPCTVVSCTASVLRVVRKSIPCEQRIVKIRSNAAATTLAHSLFHIKIMLLKRREVFLFCLFIVFVLSLVFSLFVSNPDSRARKKPKRV